MARLLTVVCVLAFTACVPRSNETPNELLNFAIQPEGVWRGLCIDGVSMTSQSSVGITGQMKTIEFLSNNKVKFTTDFISGSCADINPKVQLRHVKEGSLSYGQSYRHLNDDVRLREFSIKINREYHQAKTKAGLTFMQSTRELGMNSRVGDMIEIESDDFYFAEAEGFLAVNKNSRNAMNVFVDSKERMNAISDDVIEKNLIPSNLYVQNKIK
ncbi:MAG: hypothetical protein OYH77_08380 [Pseudomonadota bacterium]|nr:hypothetical protein [Pseudomonadota bacterium]